MSADFSKNQYNVRKDKRQHLINQFIAGIKSEQESYLMSHPEIMIMLKRYIAKNAAHRHKPINALKNAALYFTRPTVTLQKEINETQNLSTPYRLYSPKDIEKLLECENLMESMLEELSEYEIVLTDNPASETNMSSFISVLTSSSTLPTPERVVALDETISEMLCQDIFRLVDKAVFSQETDEYILYDIAYTEIMKVVEVAMELTVVEIRKDLAELLELAYIKFDLEIKEKARIALEKTKKDTVMRNNKKNLRHRINYKGYGGPLLRETSPQKALEYDQSLSNYRFNRYPKDKFGVYLPGDSKFSDESVTLPVEDIFNEFHRKSDMDAIRSLDSKLGILLTTTPSTYHIYNTKSCTNKKMNYINKRKHQLSSEINQTTKMLLFKTNPILFR